MNKRNREATRRCILRTPDGILCKDNLLRSFVMFGTPRWTCKFYKSKGWAIRAAQKLGLSEWEVSFLYEGDSIDATGNITRNRKENNE